MVRTLIDVLARLVGLRRDELVRALPVGLLYGMVLASMYVLKPARNALFLDRFGAEQLPYALLLVAVVGGVGAAAYARRSRPMQVQRLVLWLFLGLSLCLVGFWLALPLGYGALIYVFYVWVNLFGLIATSLIWLLANTVFDPREARRVFGFIGAAGIAGAILGGAFTQGAAQRVGTNALLLVCAVMLALGAALAQVPQPLDSEPRRRRTREPEPEGAIAAVKQSRLLRAVVPMVGCAAVVSVVVDIQFNAVVQESFAQTDAKTAFFGSFFAVLNGFAFLFQLVVVPRVLARVGVGTALFALPLALVAGSVGLFMLPVLAVAIVAKAADGGLRHSLNRSATEILFLPVPVALKQRAKMLLDSTVDNLGTGAGALLALLLTAGLSLPYRYLSLVALGAAAVWLAAAWRARQAYVDAFRTALSRRQIDLSELRTKPSDAASVSSLLGALRGSNERQVAYSLDMLSTVRSALVGPALRGLLTHPSASIRARAVSALAQQSDSTALPEVERLIADDDEAVRVEAVHYVCTRAPRTARERLQRYLNDDDPRIQGAALGCISRHAAADAAQLLSDELVASVLGRPGPAGVAMRCQLARALGNLDADASIEHLKALSTDESPEVARAVIEAAGQLRALVLAPWLIRQLGHHRTRSLAGRALARLGTDVLPTLAAAVDSPELSPRVRHSIPRVLGRIPSQSTVDLLLRRLASTSGSARQEVLKALNRLRSNAPDLGFDPTAIRPVLDDVLTHHVALGQIRRRYAQGEFTPEQLLMRALREKQRESLEHGFRLLGLLYPPGDIYDAYLALVSGKKVVHASGVEFLDNVVDRDTMRRLLPVLEPEARRRTGSVPPPPPSHEDWLVPLLDGDDSWLRVCAVYAAAPAKSQAVRTLLQRAAQDPHPVVRETATLVLNR